jgi:hypothetical protein
MVIAIKETKAVNRRRRINWMKGGMVADNFTPFVQKITGFITSGIGL